VASLEEEKQGGREKYDYRGKRMGTNRGIKSRGRSACKLDERAKGKSSGHRTSKRGGETKKEITEF